MPTLNIKEKSYEFSLNEVKNLIAENLNTNPKELNVNYLLSIENKEIDGKDVSVPKVFSITVNSNLISFYKIKDLISKELNMDKESFNINYDLVIKNQIVNGKITSMPKLVSISANLND